MINVGVVEDDARSAAVLAGLLRAYGQHRDVELSISLIGGGAELVARHSLDTDVLLVDIEMPGVDGVTAAGRIREIDRAVALIFVSHALQHAVRGYGVGASGFLAKPVSYPALVREMDKALDGVRARASTVQLAASGTTTIRLAVDEIVHLEVVAPRRVVVHTLDGRHVVNGPLKDIEVALRGVGFFRCHHGVMVNLRHVVGVQGPDCRLITGVDVPISRPRRTPFLSALVAHLGTSRR